MSSKKKTVRLDASNDAIPADEMLLAETVAHMRATGVRAATGAYWLDELGQTADEPRDVACACAVGGVALARGLHPMEAFMALSDYGLVSGRVIRGNDQPGLLTYEDGRRGEDLGHAFQDYWAEG